MADKNIKINISEMPESSKNQSKNVWMRIVNLIPDVEDVETLWVLVPTL